MTEIQHTIGGALAGEETIIQGGEFSEKSYTEAEARQIVDQAIAKLNSQEDGTYEIYASTNPVKEGIGTIAFKIAYTDREGKIFVLPIEIEFSSTPATLGETNRCYSERVGSIDEVVRSRGMTNVNPEKVIILIKAGRIKLESGVRQNGQLEARPLAPRSSTADVTVETDKTAADSN